MYSFQGRRKLGETVRSLRERGLTFSQIAQELKQPLSTCYSAMRTLKLSRDYAESLKMVVKKRKRKYTASLQSRSSCCSSSESYQFVKNAPLQASSSSSSSSPVYVPFGSTSTTNQLLQVVNKSIEAAPCQLNNKCDDVADRQAAVDRPTASFQATTTSFAVAEPTTSFAEYQTISSAETTYPDDVKQVVAAPTKSTDCMKVSVLEESAEQAITHKLSWALEQLENSRKPEEIIQLMNVVASALNILNNLKLKDTSSFQ